MMGVEYMKNQEMKLSLGDKSAFIELKADFDNVLKHTLFNLTEKSGNIAEINMKLKISLDKSCIKSFAGGEKDGLLDVKEAYKPKFEHKLTSVIQTKNSVEGRMNEEFALVWDSQLNEFVLKAIEENEQMTLDFLGLEYEDSKKMIERENQYAYSEQNGVVQTIDFEKKKKDKSGL